MSPIRSRKVLKKRLYALRKREHFLKRMNLNRRSCVLRLRLRQRLRLDLYNWKMKQKQRRAEQKKKSIAKKETAKLNRTLKRRRKK